MAPEYPDQGETTSVFAGLGPKFSALSVALGSVAPALPRQLMLDEAKTTLRIGRSQSSNALRQ
jgi:hypothetical protein